MTITEVRDQLAGTFPRKTIVVSESAFYHGRGLEQPRYVEFVISIEPALDGFGNTQNFGGDTLDECLRKLNLVQHATPHGNPTR